MTWFVNLSLYQLGWFACVLGAAWDLQWPGVCIALCLFGAHLWLAKDRVLQVKIALMAAAVGLTVDSILLWGGVFAFPHGAVLDWLPPPFMTALWMEFATTFRYSMKWLSGRYALGAFFGLVGAPLAFFAGERLGAIEFLAPRMMHFAFLGLLWALCVPLLIYISDRLSESDDTDSSYRWPGMTQEKNAASAGR